MPTPTVDIRALTRATYHGDTVWTQRGSGAGLYLEVSRTVFRSIDVPRLELSRIEGWKNNVDQVIHKARTRYELLVDGNRVDLSQRKLKALFRAVTVAPAPSAEKQAEIQLQEHLFQDTRSLYAAFMHNKNATEASLQSATKLPDDRFHAAIASMEKDGSIDRAGHALSLTIKGLDAAWLRGNRMYDGMSGF